MRARGPLAGSSFGPAAINVMTGAFDDAWAEIGSSFAQAVSEAEGARLRFANAILAVTTEGSDDPAALNDAARRIMASQYRGQRVS